jgi:hypothetical protein
MTITDSITVAETGWTRLNGWPSVMPLPALDAQLDDLNTPKETAA